MSNTINTNANVLSTKEQNKLEKQTRFNNNVHTFMNDIKVEENALVINETKLTEKDFAFKEDGFADLTQYTNLKNPELEKQFKAINKYRKAIRLSLVHIGGVLFDIQQTKSYKKNAKDFGMKTTRFEEFCTKVLGIPKTSAYRYIAVYTMCADITGKVDERIACLNNTQLYALAANHVTHDDIVNLLDMVDDITDAETAQKLIQDNAQKLIETKEAVSAETSQSGTAESKKSTPDSNTLTNIPAEKDTHIMLKCTTKGGNPIFIPREVADRPEHICNYIYSETDYTFENCKHENIIVHASWSYSGNGHAYLCVVIHDDNNKNCLTYLRMKQLPEDESEDEDED